MKRIPLFAHAVALYFLFWAANPVSVSGAYLINENFEGAGFPPAGWISQGCDRVTTPPSPSRSPTHSVLVNAINDSLKTPLLPNPGALSFYFFIEDVTRSLTVEYSTSASGPWTNVPGSPFSAGAVAWTNASADLSAHTNIYLQFRLNSTTDAFNVYIDDVSVTGTGSDATPTPTPVPSPPPSEGYLFVVGNVPCWEDSDPRTCNRIEVNSASFDASVLYSVVEVISGPEKGKRFFIDAFTSTTLYCNAGLLNDYTTSVFMAGVRTGVQCAILLADQVASGQCVSSDANTLQDITGATDWATDAFKGLYVYLEGNLDGKTVRSFFTVTNNTRDTFSVDPSLSGLPPYAGVVDYMIITNPPPMQTTPILLLETDSYPDPLCAICIRRGINYTLIPLQNTAQWNPLNVVDPYVAVLLPTGQLYFFNNGSWHSQVKAVYHNFAIGSEFSGTLGVFLMGPGLPSGKYVIYGLLNTPGAPLFNERYWRSDLTSTTFFFP
ncbi:MAG: hypothetical protein WCP22_04665 [Chlamydiota bacterium]